MKRWTREAEVISVTKDGGHVLVEAAYESRPIDGGGTYTMLFHASSHDQPRVGQRLYVAVGELHHGENRIAKIYQDAADENDARVRRES